MSKYIDKVNSELSRVEARLVDKGFKDSDVIQAMGQVFDNFDDQNKLSLDVYRCKICSLRVSENRGPVPGSGPINSPLMIIGEAPSTVEDLMGLPLVGESGMFFTITLIKAGVDRKLVRLTNIIKCRLPEGRSPISDDLAACGIHLLNEIAIIKPKVILTLGNESLRYLSDDPNLKITQERGNWREIDGIQVMPTFHPQYVLRQQTKEAKLLAKKQFWNDLTAAVTMAKTLAPNYQFTN